MSAEAWFVFKDEFETYLSRYFLRPQKR
jgi:hypothetical protein